MASSFVAPLPRLSNQKLFPKLLDAIPQGSRLLEFQIPGGIAHLALKLLQIPGHILGRDVHGCRGFRRLFGLFPPPPLSLSFA